MGDSIYDSISKVTAKEVAEALEGHKQLTPEQMAAADVNHDGRVDDADVELLANAELEVAHKISRSVDHLTHLTPDEEHAADRDGDGIVNLMDAERLANDAHQALEITHQHPHS